MERFSKEDPFLRRLLLHYKYRNCTIEEAIDYINGLSTTPEKYISYEDIEKVIIPKIVSYMFKEEYYKNRLWCPKGKKLKDLWYDYSKRPSKIIELQQIIMYILKEGFGGYRSLSEIGKLVRNKNHTTVLHACRNVDNLLETDKNFQKLFKKVKQFIILKI